MISDTTILARICGANDSNLSLIEKRLGFPVFAYGNEISIESADIASRHTFKRVIDRIMHEIKDGADAGEDMINSIFDTDAQDVCSIVIPNGKRVVYPKTNNQSSYLKAMRTRDIVFCVGPAGSGKTFLAMAEALRLVMTHKKKTIVLTRPVVEAGESLGFLPGDFEQKINPYLRPLYDSIEAILPRDVVKKITANGTVEIAPLAYMRGRTLNDCVIILDEAQNTYREQMKMFLTRMGENSKVFVTGDITQIDIPDHEQSGLVHAMRILRNITEIAMMFMDNDDVVRNPLIKNIVQAYEHE